MWRKLSHSVLLIAGSSVFSLSQTPAGPTNAVQYNNGGAFGGGAFLLANPSSQTLFSQNTLSGNFEGYYFADQFQSSPGSGDGISSLFSATCTAVRGCFVISSPSYTSSEQPFSYGVNIPLPFTYFLRTPLSVFEDDRNGSAARLFRDPTRAGTTNTHIAYTHGCMFATPLEPAIANSGGGDCFDLSMSGANPGYSHGSPPFMTAPSTGTPLGIQGWSVGHATEYLYTNFTPGIHQLNALSFANQAVGDTMGAYYYVQTNGGSTAPGDEGFKGLAGNTGESGTQYYGTVTSGGTGATAITTSASMMPIAGGSFSANGSQGDGSFLLDISQGVPAYYYSADSTDTLLLRSWSVTSGVIKFNVANAFSAGDVVRLDNFSNSSVLHCLNNTTITVLSAGLSTSTFEANVTCGSSGGSDTDFGNATRVASAVLPPASITSWSVSSTSVATFQASNVFSPGANVILEGFNPSNPSNVFNGLLVTVLSNGLSGSQFEANVNVTPGLSGTDSGSAYQNGPDLISLPSAGQPPTPITASTGIGVTQNAAIPSGCTSGTPIGTCTQNVVVNVILQSVGSIRNGVVCFADGFHEQAVVVSHTSSAPGTEQLTVALREPHPSNTMVFQGGSSCEFGSFDANLNTTPRNGNSGPYTDPQRYTFEIFGAPDAQHLYVGALAGGALAPLPKGNVSTLVKGITINSFSSGSLYFYLNGGVEDITFIGQSITINSSTAGLSNLVCSNVQLTTPMIPSTATYKCNISSGSLSSPAPGFITLGTNGYGNTGFGIYPGAQVLDVQTYPTGTVANAPPSVSGSFDLEPNTVAWATSDNVEEPHYPVGAFCGICWGLAINSPQSASSAGYSLGLYGQGIKGGLASQTTSFDALRITNSNSNTMYQGSGGTALAPGGIRLRSGEFSYGLAMDQAPQFGGSLLYAGTPPTGLGDPNATYNIVSAVGNNGGMQWQYSPYANSLNIGPSGNQIYFGHYLKSAIPACNGQNSNALIEFGDPGSFCYDASMGVTYMQDVSIGTKGITSYEGLTTAGLGLAPIVATLSQTGTGSGSVTLACAGETGVIICPAGLYRYNGYAVITSSSSTTGTLTLGIGWQDGTAARILNFNPIAANGTNYLSVPTGSIFMDGSVNPTAQATLTSTSGGSSVAFSYYLVLERTGP